MKLTAPKRSVSSYISRKKTKNNGNGSIKAKSGSSKVKSDVQLVLDLALTTRRTCQECGMSYITFSATDIRDHAIFHKSFLEGVYLKGCDPELIETIGSDSAAIVRITPRSSGKLQARADKILSLVSSELCAPLLRIGDNESFQLYVYLRKDHCIGAVLVQRIEQAYKTIKISESLEQVLQEKQQSVLGFSRIWTHASCRRQGIASSLLNAARRNAVYGLQVSLDQIAFSQPSQSGMALISKYVGPKSICVYE